MANKPDLNTLMSMIDSSDDLMDNIDKLSLLMGSPEKGEKVKSLMANLMKQETNEISGLSRSMSHTDPAINLLLALKPFLNQKKQVQMDRCLKSLNMTYFVRQLGEISKDDAD